MDSDVSVIQLSPASQAWVDDRVTTLGPWVIGGALDCVLMGVVFCQVQHFIRNYRHQRVYMTEPAKRIPDICLVALVTTLSVLKTIQVVGIVWEQNVMAFADPDKARLLANTAWWQVSAPLMTGITGFVVQSFFAYRFFKLTGNPLYTFVIGCAMVVGIIGSAFSTVFIMKNDMNQKVTWLMVHLVSVCISDVLITIGTVYALYNRNSGLSSTTSMIKRLLRLVFEAAVPPALIATIDLILTQTLNSRLLWHLVLNYCLAKLYVISLLYTLNSIGDYRTEHLTNGKLTFCYGNSRVVRLSRVGDIELNTLAHSAGDDGPVTQIQLPPTQLSSLSQPPLHSPITPITPITPLGLDLALRKSNSKQTSSEDDDPDSVNTRV